MYMPGLKNITNDYKYKDYLAPSAEYFLLAIKKEIEHKMPNVDFATVDLNSPEIKALIKDIPFKINVMGGLAQSLGIDDIVMTPELLNHLLNGYVPVEYLPENSHLRAYALQTEIGALVPLNNNKARIENGQYVSDGTKRASTEALFTSGKRESAYITSLALSDPRELKRAEERHARIMSQVILPKLAELARMRVQNESNETVPADGYQLVVVSVMHIDSRAGEPHIHFHDEILNTSMSKDGRLYSLDADDIYNNKFLLDALYEAAEKEEMEREYNLRYEPVYAVKDENNEQLADDEKVIVSYDLAKDIVPDYVFDHFTTRSKEIEAEIATKGLANTAKTREIAQKSTRDDKQEISPSEMMDIWRKEFEQLGYQAQRYIIPLDNKTEQLSGTTEQQAKNFQRKLHEERMERQIEAAKHAYNPSKAVKKPLTTEDMMNPAMNRTLNLDANKLVKSFNEKTGTVDFHLSQFKAHVIKQAINTCSAEVALREADRIADEQCVMYLDPKNPHYAVIKAFTDGLIADPAKVREAEILFERHARFITKPVIEAHNRIAHGCMARAHEDRWSVPQEIVTEEIMKYEKEKGFLLSSDQVEDIRTFFTQPGAVVSTAGMAGTGKSTAAEIKVRVLIRMGFEVWGTSVSSEATKGLAKSAHIDAKHCHNSAKLLALLDAGKVKLHDKSVVIFDEAGMADIFTFDRLLAHAHAAGAKVNFMGEKEQLQPVGAANMFKYLNENFTTVPLTSINRQNTEEKRNNVKLFQRGEAQKAIEQMEDFGWVKEVKSMRDAWELAAKLYVENPRPETEKIMMSDTNVDNDNINLLIKEKMRERGELDPNAKQVKLKCGDGLEREFGEGDRISFFKATKSNNIDPVDINNSQTGRILEIKTGRFSKKVNALLIQLDEIDPMTGKKREVIVGTDKLINFRHGWAGTVYKAQGASVPHSYRVPSLSMSPNAFIEYVASSRYKEDHSLILSEEFKDRLLKKAYNLEATEKQLSKLDWLNTTQGIEVPALARDSYGQASKFLSTYKHLEQPGNKFRISDEYSELIHKLSQQPFKKNVSDFVAVPNGMDILKSIVSRRKADLARFQEHVSELAPVEKSPRVFKRGSKDVPVQARGSLVIGNQYKLKRPNKPAKELNAAVESTIHHPKKKIKKEMALSR